MKKVPVILLLLFISLLTYSQLEYYQPPKTIINHKAGEIIISASPNMVFSSNGGQLAGGAKIQVFLGRRFSLDADLVVGRDYFHISPGLIGVPFGLIALLDESEDTMRSFLLSLLGIALSLEHFSYHIPLKDDLELSPYVSFLRYRLKDYAYIGSEFMSEEVTKEQFCFATGIQMNKYFGRFVLAPYADYSIGYSTRSSGLNVGVYLGFNFNR